MEGYKRFSHLSMMLEIESKRCNPSIQQKSYGDVKAIAFSVVEKNTYLSVNFQFMKMCVNACICVNDNV